MFSTLAKTSKCFLVFDSVEKYAPGFKDSIVGADILTPSDLERIFGLTGGVSLKIDFYILSRLFFCKCVVCYLFNN